MLVSSRSTSILTSLLPRHHADAIARSHLWRQSCGKDYFPIRHLYPCKVSIFLYASVSAFPAVSYVSLFSSSAHKVLFRSFLGTFNHLVTNRSVYRRSAPASHFYILRRALLPKQKVDAVTHAFCWGVTFYLEGIKNIIGVLNISNHIHFSIRLLLAVPLPAMS